MKFTFLLALFMAHFLYATPGFAKHTPACTKFLTTFLKAPAHEKLKDLEAERKVFKLGNKISLPKGCFESLFIYDGIPRETKYNRINAENLRVTYLKIFKTQSFILSSFSDTVTDGELAFKYSFFDPKTEQIVHSQIGFIKVDGVVAKALSEHRLAALELFLGRELVVDPKIYRKSYK